MGTKVETKQSQKNQCWRRMCELNARKWASKEVILWECKFLFTWWCFLILFLWLVFFQCCSLFWFSLCFSYVAVGSGVAAFPFICWKLMWADYCLDHSVLPCIAILAYFIPCLIFGLIYLCGMCSFLTEIIVTSFSHEASGCGNLLGPVSFGRIFEYSW